MTKKEASHTVTEGCHHTADWHRDGTAFSKDSMMRKQDWWCMEGLFWLPDSDHGQSGAAALFLSRVAAGE